MNYNTQEKWNFQEIEAMLIQEEGRLKKMKDKSIHLMTHDGANNGQSKPSKKGKQENMVVSWLGFVSG